MSYLMVEFRCRRCQAVSESLELRASAPQSTTCACGGKAERILSAPKTAVQRISAVSMGKSDPIPKGGYDTRPIADGEMSVKEWRQARNKLHRDRRYTRIKRDLGL